MKPLRFSYSAWSRLKDCAHSYFLRYVQKVPTAQDNWYTIVGKVPGRQAEMFFRLPAGERKIEWFAETFDQFWAEQIEGSTNPNHQNAIDWVGRGRDLLAKAGNQDPDTETVFRTAYLDRREETLKTSRSLARLVESQNYLRIEAETELKFEMSVHPGEDAQPWERQIDFTGYIDLVIKREDSIEVWDWKATSSPSKLDVDQLVLYWMALQNAGKPISKVGYLLIKQERAETRTVNDAVAYSLRKELRKVGLFFQQNVWPPNVREWKCKMCDVRGRCQAAKAKGLVP